MIDQKAFRQALGSFATGVTVVTARAGDGTCVGVTANSFNSVSLEPPLILWSLDRKSYSLPVFEHTEHFIVNVLAADQVTLSNRFAWRGRGDKFNGIDFRAGAGGAPVISGCAATFQCRKAFSCDGGDHVIFVGEVLAAANGGRPGLVFHRGGYAVTEPHAATGRDGTPSNDGSFATNYLDYLLAHVAARFRCQFEHVLHRANVTYAQWRLLYALERHQGGLSVEQLSAMSLVPDGEMNQVLSGLLASGWVDVAQYPNEFDIYSLTEAGATRLSALLSAAREHEADFLGQLPATDVDQLKATLKSLLSSTDFDRQSSAYLYEDST